ncbi:DUF4214 domain-containing protein [Methylocystis echinoides]|uniref:DUF4214 domain-containing protein n=1 Tax=Methylocystis echinoides TaxID=29468 RepID=UPI003448E5DD
MTTVVDNFNPVLTGVYYGDSNQDAIWAGHGMPPGYLENFDFSQAVFYSFEQINYNWMAMDMPGKATFSSSQFGDGLIGNDVQIYGAWGRTDFIVNMASGGSLNMSAWQFVQGKYYNWLTGEDYVFINGAPGNETIIGSPVADTFVFKGNSADYKISSNGAGGFIVSDAVAGRDGRDSITGVEFLQFRDQTVATSSLTPAPPSSPPASATPQQLLLGLYAALYDRAAEMPGYSYWVDYLRQQPDARGVTLANAHVGSTTSQDAKALGQAFVTTQSAFFDATYGRLSDPQFVEALYTNIGGNAGDAGGIRYWTSQLQGLRSEGLGTQAARAQIAGAFVQAMISYDIPANAASLSSSEFQAAVERQDSFKNKIAVSLAYANASGQTGGEILVPHSVTDAAYQAAIRAIDHVTFDVRTVNVAILGINNSVAHQDLSLIV